MCHGILYLTGERIVAQTYATDIRDESFWILGCQHSGRSRKSIHSNTCHSLAIKNIWCLVLRCLGFVHTLPICRSTILLCHLIHVQLRYSGLNLHTVHAFHSWRNYDYNSVYSPVDTLDWRSWRHLKMGILCCSILLCNPWYSFLCLRLDAS